AGVARDRLHCPVRRETRGRLAADLCGDGDDVALSQRLRADHPVVPESARIGGAGAERTARSAVRPGVRRRAGRRVRVIRAGHHRWLAPVQADGVRLIHCSAARSHLLMVTTWTTTPTTSQR